MTLWLNAKRKFNKADFAVTNAFIQSVNVVKETLNRSLSLPDVAGHAMGLVPAKKLRLRVVILRDEAGTPLADPAAVEAAQATFEREVRTKIIPSGDQWIETLDTPAPVEALDVHCDFEAWKEGLKEAGNYFERYLHRNAAGNLIGYAAPITVFIVRAVSGKAGCSLGPLADYVTVAAHGLQPWGCDHEGRAIPRTLTHEVGHACGLWHVRDTSNLMHPRGPGLNLRAWQKLILRNSRHVTYF